jgi:segregation and condensation protein A
MTSGEWSRLDEYLIAYVVEPEMRATAFASSLAATLELVREGAIELHQEGTFGPIFLRQRAKGPEGPGGAGPGAEPPSEGTNVVPISSAQQ